MKPFAIIGKSSNHQLEDSIALDWAKWNAKRKAMGRKFKRGAGDFGSGVLGGIGQGIGTRKKQTKITGGKTRSGRVGQSIGRGIGGIFVGPSLRKVIQKKKYGH